MANILYIPIANARNLLILAFIRYMACISQFCTFLFKLTFLALSRIVALSVVACTMH